MEDEIYYTKNYQKGMEDQIIYIGVLLNGMDQKNYEDEENCIEYRAGYNAAVKEIRENLEELHIEMGKFRKARAEGGVVEKMYVQEAIEKAKTNLRNEIKDFQNSQAWRDLMDEERRGKS
ncbi:MAG: hypothetical protein GY754_25610 [bacterium]|nr:hypothetical protein [bacterium]